MLSGEASSPCTNRVSLSELPILIVLSESNRFTTRSVIACTGMVRVHLQSDFALPNWICRERICALMFSGKNCLDHILHLSIEEDILRRRESDLIYHGLEFLWPLLFKVSSECFRLSTSFSLSAVNFVPSYSINSTFQSPLHIRLSALIYKLSPPILYPSLRHSHKGRHSWYNVQNTTINSVSFCHSHGEACLYTWNSPEGQAGFLTGQHAHAAMATGAHAASRTGTRRMSLVLENFIVAWGCNQMIMKLGCKREFLILGCEDIEDGNICWDNRAGAGHGAPLCPFSLAIMPIFVKLQ